MSQSKTSWTGIFLYFCGKYIVLIKTLLLGFPSMGQSHLHMFPVYYIYIQGSLVLYVFSLWFCSPVDSQGKLA